MGLQELDSSSEVPLDRADNHGITTRGVAWFSSKFPNFFTPEIVKAREAGAIPPPTRKKDYAFRQVARSVQGEVIYTSLYINLRDSSYKLVCTTSIEEWPISEATLLQATSPGGEWVNVRSGNESLRLRRSELTAAYVYLKARL